MCPYIKDCIQKCPINNHFLQKEWKKIYIHFAILLNLSSEINLPEVIYIIKVLDPFLTLFDQTEKISREMFKKVFYEYWNILRLRNFINLETITKLKDDLFQNLDN